MELESLKENFDDDPLTKLLREAPLDDEPFTDEDPQAAEESRKRDESQPPIPLEELQALLKDG